MAKKTDRNETAVETTALVAAPRDNMTALQVVENEGNVQKLGQLYAASGFFGQVSPSAATAALVNCFLEGLSPVQYKAKYHVFDNGQTGVKSDFIQREFHRLGGKWTFVEWTPTVCDMVFTYQGEKMPFRVTLDEFKANGVACDGKGKLKTNWAKFPREMLKARCMATAIRALCPEALGGLYTQEEVADFDRAPSAPVQAAPTAVSPSPVAAKDENGDADVCPCGSVKGKRWSELDTDVIDKILRVNEEKHFLTDAHMDAIKAVMIERAASEDEPEEAEIVGEE